MKTNHKRKFLNLLVGGLFMGLIFSACDKDSFENPNGDPTYSTTGNASGSQQTPPVTTSGSGTITGTYNATTNRWDYDINWSALAGSATAVEIHGPSAIGASGALQVALAITTPGVTGTAMGTVTLTQEQENYLLTNQLYYTILTTSHVTGEVRGQITATLLHD